MSAVYTFVFMPSIVIMLMQCQIFSRWQTAKHLGVNAFCRINLGTADELALDMLINALSTFSKE